MLTETLQAVVVRECDDADQGAQVSGVGVDIKFLTVGAQSGGQIMSMKYTAPARFAGPPPHYHRITTEIFHVLEGTLTLRVGDQTVHLDPGGYAYVPPGVVHGFSNTTDSPTVYFCLATPAGLEHYFAELAELVRNDPQWPPRDMRKLLALMSRYDTYPPPQAA